MDITKTSKSPSTQVKKMGQTANGSFGSNPNATVKGSRSTRDLGINTKGR